MKLFKCKIQEKRLDDEELFVVKETSNLNRGFDALVSRSVQNVVNHATVA